MIKGFIGLILFVNSINVLAQNAVNNKSKKPNILMICVDDLNDYIGAMGHPDAITPNMDKLIKRGTLFTNAQTQSPLCGPSRAALMTGLRPSTTGIYGLIPDNDVKGSNDATRNNIFMHQYFKNNGYYTMGRGKMKTEIVAIPATNILESSPFLYRHELHIYNGELPEEWAGRMKLGKVSFPQYNHAWEKTIPASLYDEHPTWFAQIDGKHLPPGERYKLETTNPELVQAYANVIIKEFRKDTSLKWYSLSPSDGINGEVGWSNSKEALALIEKRANGKNSRTSLILKFYNNVAKIVRKEFPDNKFGCYIYADYFYPSSSGIPKMEPNLAFMIATHVSYGYQLYRKATQVEWESVVSAWAKSAKENGFDIYYYDLPTAIMQHNGIVMPPAPEILNFIYPRLLKYGFKGAYIYGRPVWPVFGPSNYTIAKMKWNPKLDANNVLREYYQKAYGNSAAVHVEKLYNKLDSGYKVFYNNHLKQITI